jgi:hypothetical protein
MRPIQVTLTPQSDDDGISLSQTPAAGGAQDLTITGALASGGSVTLNHGHLIVVTAAADDSARIFTITGTDFRGYTITDTIGDGATTGPNAGTATSTSYFKTVTGVSVDADTAGAIEVGVDGTSASNWYILDEAVRPFNVGIGAEVTATATYTVQHTFDDLQTTSDLNSVLTALNHDDLASKTATDDGNYVVPVRASRLIISAYTSGTVVFTLMQAG